MTWRGASLNSYRFPDEDRRRHRAARAAYAELRRAVVAARLLDRTPGYYLRSALATYALLGLATSIPFWTPPTAGWSALAAVLMGVAMIHVGLLGHDAGHLAVFRRVGANDLLGQLCWSAFLAIGFFYWRDRHGRHHALTNDPAEDPDLAGMRPIVCATDPAATGPGWRRFVPRCQAILAGALLFFLAFAFRVDGWLFTCRRLHGYRRTSEIALLSLGSALWLAPAATLGWRWVVIYFFSQIVASVYMTLLIAPNHHGMPVWRRGARPPFLEQQVLSSRNMPAHPFWNLIFGGLDSQIEHHLFPTMPRPNLRRARTIVKPFCEAHGLRYAEASPFRAYADTFGAARQAGREQTAPAS
jgi:fatty acid desaturase